MESLNIIVEAQCPACKYKSEINPEVFADRPFICPKCGHEKEIGHQCARLAKIQNSLYAGGGLIVSADVRARV